MKKFSLATLALIFLFVLTFGILIFSAQRNSATTDEGIHLFSGYTYLEKTGPHSFRLDPEHPPFLKEIGALPLLFLDPKIPMNGLWDKAANFYYDSWQETRVLAENFLYSLGNNPGNLLFWGRFPFIILTLILGFATYLWAKKLYGARAGIFAAFLTLFFPNFLAHGHLINTDLGVVLFIFLSVYFWGKFLKTPSWPNLIYSGLFIGLSMASKFTAVLLVPILIILAMGKIFFYAEKANNLPKYILGFLGALLIAFTIIWATYGFSTEVPPPPLGSLSGNVKLWTSFNIPTSFDSAFQKARPILFPADFYKGFFLVGRHALGGHGTFLLGQTSNTGWWYYFPVAIFFKTPIPVFIFLILSIIFWKRLRAKDSFDEFLLLAPPLIFLGLSMLSKADLGIRHILTIFPFLFVFVSKSINLVDFSAIKIVGASRKKLLPALGFLVLILWYLYSTVSVWPNFLTYFNEFAGGPKGGYRILNDSNLDWGQDIFRIKKYLADHNIGEVYFLYPWNGDASLDYYGFNWQPLPWEETKLQGYAVVSTTYLELADLTWLKKYPFEQITPGVFIFKID